MECWSTNNCNPLLTPISAWYKVSFSDSLFCLTFSNFENSVSFKMSFWLKEQQMPESVGTGLNSLEQSCSLPYSIHFFKRKLLVGFFELLKQGRLEFQSRLNKLEKFLPMSSMGKLLLVRFFMISSIRTRLALLVLFKKTSIMGRPGVITDLSKPLDGVSSQVAVSVNASASRVHWSTVIPNIFDDS